MSNTSSFSKLDKKKRLVNLEDKTIDKTIDKIYNEYSLKRNNFNPIDKSPNEFVKKLKLRMRLYYDQLR